MKALLMVIMVSLNIPLVAQYNARKNVDKEMNQRLLSLNTINIASSNIVYKVARSPLYTIFRYGNYGFGYWQGLAFTKTSPDKYFESTYYYDMQGNLRETRSYFNIKRKGQLTNWSILVPTHGSSPAFVHTF